MCFLTGWQWLLEEIENLRATTLAANRLPQLPLVSHLFLVPLVFHTINARFSLATGGCGLVSKPV